jgi:hypothetical protein
MAFVMVLMDNNGRANQRSAVSALLDPVDHCTALAHISIWRLANPSPGRT